MPTASAPSPIYPLYRERWDFSVTMVTVVFAVYVVGLLGALLTLDAASDRLRKTPSAGWRPGWSTSPRRDTRRQGPQ
ncbi:hypothetical protein [Streptomyces sp. NPDC017964]|uniref:hypothetical protein n=1 Tax=Streptomyces sp. NPDC017964 TaxID=3365022 RepID=UPI003791E616